MREHKLFHKDIYKTLSDFIKSKQVPNIIFHGEHGSGKKTILKDFLSDIYVNIDDYKQYIMYVNCAEGKGIKFIRDELKFFAKTNIHNYNGSIVKSIVLLNADFLTIDAQSALRRCIELFSKYTRFFIVIEKRSSLIKPILSRFCSIHVYRPQLRKQVTNLHSLYNVKLPKSIYRSKTTNINDLFKNVHSYTKHQLIEHIGKLYQKGACGLDMLQYIENHLDDSIEKYDLLVYLETLKQEIRNEELFMFMILQYYKMRHTNYLENIDIL